MGIELQGISLRTGEHGIQHGIFGIVDRRQRERYGITGIVLGTFRLLLDPLRVVLVLHLIDVGSDAMHVRTDFPFEFRPFRLYAIAGTG